MLILELLEYLQTERLFYSSIKQFVLKYPV